MATGGTFLERYVESTAPLQPELQRLVTTLGELDQRVADLRAETRAKFEHCMELPPLSGRQQPTEADAEVLRLRKEIDDAHKMMAQLAAEKLRITATASELVTVHMLNLDHELALFSDEIVVRAREMEAEALAAQTARFEQAQHTGMMGGAPMNAYGGAQQPPAAMVPHAYMPSQAARQQHSMYGGGDVGGHHLHHHQQHHAPASMMPPPQPAGGQGYPQAAAAARGPRENNHHGSRKQRQLQPGDHVAANVAEPPGEAWIITAFIGISSAGGLYEVHDEEAEPNSVNRYFLEAHNVQPMPRSASCRDEKPQGVGSVVLGVYPGTTTFYRATVVAAPKRTPAGEWDAYTLQFEDDDQGAEPGAPLGRHVDFRHVVPLPSGGAQAM